MKNSLRRRIISLFLAFAAALSLTPSALLAENQPETPSGVLQELRLSSDAWSAVQPGQTKFELELEPNSSVDRGGVQIKASLEPGNDPEVQKMHISWTTSDPDVTAVSDLENGHSGVVYGKGPGEATVTVSAGSGDAQKKCEIHTTVSGITVSDKLAAGVTVAENQSMDIKQDTDYFLFGNADSEYAILKASIVNNKTNVRAVVSSDRKTVTLEGREAGDATVVLSVAAGGYTYEAEFPVTVTSNLALIEYTAGCSSAKPLKFSALESLIAQKCTETTNETLASVVGLNVSTAQGILYLGYKSPDDPGAGVGGSVTYYVSSAVRGPYLRDITFVPNASFAGEKAEITFTGQSQSGRSFKGKILVTLTQEKTDVTVSTMRETPLKLTDTLFSRACQEQTGSPLDYVIFTLPPASQGVLYRDWKAEGDYAARISASERYSRKTLNEITFVPARGFVGTVTVGYAGYSTSGSKFNGQLVIQVTQGLDDAITYNDNGTGYVTFSRYDFDIFSENATGHPAASVSFTPPPASQGVLYFNWNGDRGGEVTGVLSVVQLERITFVAADGFHGVVRIPFTGTAITGEEFAGAAEIHIQSVGTSGGDIQYICAPGESVKLALSDFTSLCQGLTGKRLHYISFQSLPDFTQGTLYHGRTTSGGIGTRVNTTTKYFNSATPYISNLSFWATDNFRGLVDIPFTGSATDGTTFTGVVRITNGTGDGSGSSAAVRYTASGQSPVKFSGEDFDQACRQAVNTALSYLRFDMPSSGQGILYFDYRSDENPTTLNTSTSLYRSGEVSVDKVSFVPARGFSGMVVIPFTGWGINGREFRGTVEITVNAAAARGGLVHYSSHGEPVLFSAYDIQTASGGQPVRMRLTGLPTEDQGRLYYQYVSPTQYSWRGNTSTEYNLYGDPSVSSLTFIPRAGYSGTVNIPYSATNQDGSTYTGTIRVEVSAPNASANFNDLDAYSAQTKAAVDFLYALNVVNGTGNGKYEPGASIRRGDFCLMLSRAFQFNVGSTEQGFRDVPSDAYYAQAVNELYALGVVNGVGGGRFQPNATLTRQDAALMVQRTLEQAGISVPDGTASNLSDYTDRSRVSDYAVGAVAGLIQQGLLPTSGSRLSPRANLTRADMAVLLHRAMTK